MNPEPTTGPQAAGDQAKALVFVHVPKAAGTTMQNLIQRQYRRDQIRGIGFSNPDHHDAYLAMTDEEKSRLRCILGHIPFGIQDTLPQPTELITVLRHPVARFVSEYKHMIGRGSQNRSFPAEALASLEAFLDYRVQTRTLNMQTAQISGYLPSGRIEGTVLDPLPADALARAVANLDAFLVVGLQERFDETVNLIKRRLNWPKSVVLPRQNIARQSTGRTSSTPELEQRIRTESALDMELYEVVAKRFDEEIRAEGPGFAAEVDRLRKANHRVYRIQKAYRTLVPKKLRLLLRKLT